MRTSSLILFIMILPTVCFGYLPADFDRNGIVDFYDFATFSDEWLCEDTTKGPWADVRAFGAEVDGTTDDTAAIQAAIDAVEAAGGGIVFFPVGISMVSNLVVNSSNVRLVGCATRATYLKAIAGTVGSIVTFSGAGYWNHIGYNEIRNLTIWGNATATKGLNLNHVSIFRLDCVNVTGCLDDALYLDEVWDSTFIQFKGNNCGASGKAAIHIYNGNEDNCNNIRFYAPYLEANAGYDIWIEASNATGAQNTNILFHAMKLERTRGSGETLVYISGSKGNEKINFAFCLFSGYDADDAIHWDSDSWGFGRIIGCVFWNRGHTGTAILLENGRHQVSSNLFYYWDYDIDYQNLTLASDIFMSDNRRQDEASGRIAQIGLSGVWSWSKQNYSYEVIAFTDADATPSIKQGRTFITANTGATTITMLDDGSEGETIRVLFGDSNTTIDFTGTNLHGNGGADWEPNQYDSMTCTYRAGKWYCGCF